MVVTLIVIVEYRPRLELQPVWRELPSVYQPLVSRREPAVVAVFPMASEPSDQDAKYMYFSTWHWPRLINGYSGNFPASYAQLLARMRTFPQAEAVGYLHGRGVEFIVVHGEFTAPEANGAAAATLDADPRLELVAVYPSTPGPSRLYRFRDSPGPGTAVWARPHGSGDQRNAPLDDSPWSAR